MKTGSSLANEYLTNLYLMAKKSPDPSTQNAAWILDDSFDDPFVDSDGRIVSPIVAVGINEFARGVEYKDSRWIRPEKYMYVEHAERNVIYKAAKKGFKTEGLTMLCPWAACADCARAIIQSGIARLIRHRLRPDKNGSWYSSILVGDQMMREAGIDIVEVDPIAGFRLRRNGIEVDTGEL